MATKLKMAVETLKNVRDKWEQVPMGVDYEADPNNNSPEDAVAHLAGLAIREIDETLKAIEGERHGRPRLS